MALEVITSRTKLNDNRVAAALRLAANAAPVRQCPGSLPAPRKAHLGPHMAIIATAHTLARIIYSMLRYGQTHVYAGVPYYEA